MKITIKVTKSDIKNGIKRDCDTCPIALAITRVLSPKYIIEIEPDQVNIYKHGTILMDCGDYPLPKIAKAFILKFDRGHHVNPFSFNLNVKKCFVK